MSFLKQGKLHVAERLPDGTITAAHILKAQAFDNFAFITVRLQDRSRFCFSFEPKPEMEMIVIEVKKRIERA